MHTVPFSDTQLSQLFRYIDDQRFCVLLETTKISESNRFSYLFTNPVEILTCNLEDGPHAFLSRAESILNQGFYLAGWFDYEFGYLLEPKLAGCLSPTSQNKPLATLGVFNKPIMYDHGKQAFFDDISWMSETSAASKAKTHYSIHDVHLNLQKHDYVAAISTIKSLIESGDTYQVNYTLKYLFQFKGAPEALYQDLRRNQRVSYSAFIRNDHQHILSFSPELFFEKNGRDILVRPMKGTIKRGRNSTEDEKLANYLRSDIKNRSENVMIVDLLRNDIGRLCEMGSVKKVSLFDVEQYETLHQMTSTIQGRLRPDISLFDLFQALFPSGSVTGAPKIRTMEIIHDLEKNQRGVYTGGIGFFSPHGRAVMNVPIRTVVLQDNNGEMGIGSGIVYDSDAEKEWDECLLKGRFLTEPAPAFELIETLLWQPEEGYWLLDDHLDRLCTSAVYFNFQHDRHAVERQLVEYARHFAKNKPQRVRLLLKKDGTISLQATPCDPPAPLQFQNNADSQSLPTVILSAKSTDSQSPFIYHKTTIRQLYDVERRNALQKGYYEVLFTNEKGELTEGAITNIIIRQAGRLLTPPVDSGLLNGVLRRYLLRSNVAGSISEAVLTIEDLQKAEAIYLVNSVRGIVQVRLEESSAL